MAVTPVLFAMKSTDHPFSAPYAFAVTGRGETETEEVELMSIRSKDWEAGQWKVWYLRDKDSIKSFRLDIFQTLNYVRQVSVAEIRLYCDTPISMAGLPT